MINFCSKKKLSVFLNEKYAKKGYLTKKPAKCNNKKVVSFIYQNYNKKFQVENEFFQLQKYFYHFEMLFSKLKLKIVKTFNQL